MEMKKTTALILLILTLAVYYKGYTFGTGLAATGHAKLHKLNIVEYDAKPAELWVEVHDVSPGYGVEKLKEITNILGRHRGATDQVVLFVIPNHGGKTPLHSYPEFSLELKKLSQQGYTLGMHGYSHEGGILHPEFKTNLSNAQKLVEASKQEFRAAGIDPPRYFAPPGWRASDDAAKYLQSEFDYIFYAFFIDIPNGTMPYPFHEYTWYGFDFGGLEKAKKDYRSSKGIFRLTVHLNAVNTEKNLEFLDQFLEWVEHPETRG
ncbi:MAG TPA: DUF2334 domain-containing protein [Euryarchaeota archaeon]|nr:DUF2334 domain-containing protein [Euryarchaeota archaeon]